MKFNPILRTHSMKIAAIASIVLLFCLWSMASFAADWPQWRGPNRDGISSESGWSSTWPTDGPEQLWTLDVGVGYSSVAVSDGRLYTMGNAEKTDTVYCLNADTGAEIWKYSYDCAAEGEGYPGPASTPAIDGGSVYTLSREGHVHCLNAESGDVVWSKHVVDDFGAKVPQWHFTSSPLVLDNKVILDAGIILALDKSTGDLVWKTKDYGDSWKGIKDHPQGGGYSSAVAFGLNDSKYLAAFPSTGLLILNPENGGEVMLHPWVTSWNVNAVTPLISGNEIFISSSDAGGAVLGINDGQLTQVWKSKNMKNHLSSSVLWEGYLYGFDDSQLSCLDWKTGEVKWTQKGLGKGSLMLVDGKLIVLGEKGKLVIAEASSDAYKELASAKVLDGLCWTVPVLANGKIYCRNHNQGKIVCLKVK